MRNFVLSIFAIILFGCGYHGNNPDFYERIYDWQYREMICQGYPVYQPGLNEPIMPILVDVERWVRHNLSWCPTADLYYWPTSCEVILCPQNYDCKGFAVATYTLLRENKLSDEILYIAKYHNHDRNRCHAMVNVYLDDGDFFIIDPRRIYFGGIAKASYVLENNPLILKYEFNLFDIRVFN